MLRSCKRMEFFSREFYCISSSIGFAVIKPQYINFFIIHKFNSIRKLILEDRFQSSNISAHFPSYLIRDSYKPHLFVMN